MRKFTFLLTTLVVTMVMGVSLTSCGGSDDDDLGIETGTETGSNNSGTTSDTPSTSASTTQGIGYLCLNWGAKESEVKSYMTAYSDYAITTDNTDVSLYYKNGKGTGDRKLTYAFGSLWLNNATYSSGALNRVAIEDEGNTAETWTQFFTSNCSSSFTVTDTDGLTNYEGEGRYNGTRLHILVSYHKNYDYTYVTISPLLDIIE